MNVVERRVLKLGGSLLDWAGWPAALAAWLASPNTAQNLLIPGGGGLADEVRKLDRVHALDRALCHRMCLRAMSIHAEMVAAIIDSARVCRTWSEIDSSDASVSVYVIDVDALAAGEPDLMASLPESWEVTSDTIAAAIAAASGAELVLLKSALPEPGESLTRAAERGYVDPFFPRAAAGRLVRCVNLRDPAFAERTLKTEN